LKYKAAKQHMNDDYTAAPAAHECDFWVSTLNFSLKVFQFSSSKYHQPNSTII